MPENLNNKKLPTFSLVEIVSPLGQGSSCLVSEEFIKVVNHMKLTQFFDHFKDLNVLQNYPNCTIPSQIQSIIILT